MTDEPEKILRAAFPDGIIPHDEGTYSVYIGHIRNRIEYVGITRRDPDIRFDEHWNLNTGRANLTYKVLPSAGTLSNRNARISEQILINYYKLQRNGGQLQNLINSISPKKLNKYGITLNF